MSLLPIITGANHPMLRTKTKKVPKVTKAVRALVKDMEETLKKANGLGLAAPQVNEDLRLCLVQIGGRTAALINPQIMRKSKETQSAEEGCLSLPDVWLQVERAVEIVVRYTDLSGAEQERHLTDMEARITQHELDHLDGILIVDYAPHARAM
jgi:peptide deformylase